MTGDRTSKIASGEAGTPHESEFESWLRQAAHEPPRALVTRLPVKGQVIGGKYRIESELGSGGMGAVFRATHLVSDKAVALKWMFRPATDARALRRLTREARAAGRIDHPNVVDVYDIGRDGDASYLVMELLHGESLGRRLSRGPLESRAVIDLLLPAMHGVAAAHRAGVIHRDLKPDNIFLCCGPEGEPRASKVLDFGIAAITAFDPALQSALTNDDALLGTPAYMAPEQLAQAKQVDARTDIYAFGVILYEALTGRLPFEADSYLGLGLAIVGEQPRGLRELRPEISLELESSVLRVMEKDPAQRPQHMEALIEALVAFASPGELRGERERRVGWVVWALAGVLVLTLSFWWFAYGSQPRAALTHRLPDVRAGAHSAASPSDTNAAPPGARHDEAAKLVQKPPAAVPAPAKQPDAGPTTKATRSSAAKSEPKQLPTAHEKPQTPTRRRAGAIRVDEL